MFVYPSEVAQLTAKTLALRAAVEDTVLPAALNEVERVVVCEGIKGIDTSIPVRDDMEGGECQLPSRAPPDAASVWSQSAQCLANGLNNLPLETLKNRLQYRRTEYPLCHKSLFECVGAFRHVIVPVADLVHQLTRQRCKLRPIGRGMDMMGASQRYVLMFTTTTGPQAVMRYNPSYFAGERKFE